MVVSEAWSVVQEDCGARESALASSEMISWAYGVLAVAGCLYIVGSAAAGHLGDSGDSGPHGHHGGHGGHGAEFHFPFFSPLALATLATAIGGFGLIAKHGLDVSDTASLLLALPVAMVAAYATTYVAFRLVEGSRGSSQFRMTEITGAQAEVVTPIPVGGVGEVSAMVQGQRFSGPAREADGLEVARGALVTVVSMVGPTMVVRKVGSP
jgi:membrane protein implicated in regulation of membrane protease activity